jgi:hypothetical protein
MKSANWNNLQINIKNLSMIIYINITRSSCHYINHVKNSVVRVSNVIIFSAVNKSETKGRNIANLIIRFPLQKMKNVGRVKMEK